MHVYLITNIVNGKMYVGQHIGKDLDRYLRDNVAAAMRGDTGKRLLYRAIRKYGRESFDIRSIYIPSDKDDMDRAEVAFIRLFSTRNNAIGYNLTDGGDGVSGLVMSPESKEKMRQAALLRGGIPDSCRKAQREYLSQRKFSDEHRRRLSESRKGMRFSEEHKQRLKESRAGYLASRAA